MAQEKQTHKPIIHLFLKGKSSSKKHCLQKKTIPADYESSSRQHFSGFFCLFGSIYSLERSPLPIPTGSKIVKGES